jgi:chaperonin cofactor prefoldin
MQPTTLQKHYLTKKEFNSAISELKSAVKELKLAVNELKTAMAKLTGIVLRIEQRNNIYSDMCEMSKWNVNKLANRVNSLEKQAGLTPPKELLISGL